MPEDPALRLIVVMGMHRSGTSILSRGMQVLGVELGTRLMSAMDDNPRGYWEDVDVVAINEKVLAALSSDWRSPLLAHDEQWRSAELEALSSTATRLILTRLESYPRWGLKDPRLCRLLPFWQPIFRQVGVHEDYVITLRNPRAVCDSLRLRDRIPPELGYLLWIEHIAAALLGTHGKRRVLVDYDLALEHPVQQLCRIGKTLALPPASEGDPVWPAYEQEFLDPALRHHQYPSAISPSDSHLAQVALHAFCSLRDIASERSASCDEDLQVLAASLRKEIQSLFELFPLAIDLSRGIQAAELELYGVRKEMRQQRLELSHVSHHSAEVRAENKTLKANAESLAAANHDLIALRENLTTALHDLAAANQRLTETNQVLNETTRSLTATVETLRSQSNDGNARLAIEAEKNRNLYSTLLEENRRLWNSGSWRLLRPVRNSLRIFMGQPKESQPNPTNALEAVQVITALRQSISWELTSPLRILRRILSRPLHVDQRSPQAKDEPR